MGHCGQTYKFFTLHSSRDIYSSEQLAQIYIHEIARLHGVAESIISDWGTQFTSKFSKVEQ